MNSICLTLISLLFFSSCVPTGDKSTLVQFKDNNNTSLNNRSVASTSNLEQEGLVVRMNDRYYVSSLLLDVFGATANSIVNNYIKYRLDVFGGGCDQYEKNTDVNGTCISEECNLISCSGANIIHNQIGTSSAIRQGWLIRACEEITNADNAVLFTVRNIHDKQTLSKTTVPAPTADTLKMSYELFYRTGVANNSVISALTNIAATETTNNFEKWRYVLLSLCTTPEWQIP